MPNTDSASITVTWKWNGSEFDCIRRTVVVYETVSGNVGKMKMHNTTADKSETSYTLQDLLCNKQYIICVKGIIGGGRLQRQQ